ncbi:MAG: hypothetical protein O7G86_18415 [Gammaproteobacteria bacterium]|nr:hypothetical protein [Gammaproteobacteria bacterium]
MNDRPPPRWHKPIDAAGDHPLTSFVLFIFVLMLLGVVSAIRSDQEPINTDMLSLVGFTDADPVRAAGTKRIGDYAEQRQTWIISHPQLDQAYLAAEALQADLADSDLYDLSQATAQVTDADVLAIYEAYRYQLADDVTLNLARSGDDAALVSRVERTLFSNAMVIPAEALSEDPFLIKAHFFQDLFRTPAPFIIDRGYLAAHVAGNWNYLVSARLTHSAFDFDYQAQISDFTQQLVKKYADQYQVNIQPIGVIDYAIANRELALREIQLIGVLSIAMVTLLLISTFRSLHPYSAVAFTIISGLAGGFFACLALFQSVHLLTLIGGSSLIGISVDYSFHLLADSFRARGDVSGTPDNPGQKEQERWRVSLGLKTVAPAISLGLATSVLGFLGLYASGFRGLQEIAIFSAVGLVTAFAGLILCYPWLLAKWRPTERVPLTLRIAKAWSGLFTRSGRSLIAVAALTIVLVALAPRQNIDNNLRLLAARTPEIENLQEQSGFLAGSIVASQFIVVTGNSTERLLQKEEKLRDLLLELINEGAILHFNQLSRFVPSAKRQNETYLLNRRLFLEPGTAIDALALRIGLTDGVVRTQRNALSETLETETLALSDWLNSPTAMLAQHLWLGEIDTQMASVVTLGGIVDLAALEARLLDLDGVRLVDNVSDMSEVFALYVDNALTGLAIAFVLVTGLMLWQFGFSGGLFIMLAPLLSGVLTMTTLMFLNEPINLFHIVGLALILGMGMDYTLFLKTSRQRSSAMLAVLMAAVTTEFAFGLLSASSVGAIHSFGLTVAIGTAISFFVAPLVAKESGQGEWPGSHMK